MGSSAGIITTETGVPSLTDLDLSRPVSPLCSLSDWIVLATMIRSIIVAMAADCTSKLSTKHPQTMRSCNHIGRLTFSAENRRYNMVQ